MRGRGIGVKVQDRGVIADGCGIHVRTGHAFSSAAQLDMIVAGNAHVRIALRLQGRDAEPLCHAFFDAT